MTKYPAQFELGAFVPNTNATPVLSVISIWNTQAGGSINWNIWNQIDTFHPDVIVSFDPRHGTTCHTEHRATGEIVRTGVTSYVGVNFPAAPARFNKVLFLTTRLIGNPTDPMVSYLGLAPAVRWDNKIVVYSAQDNTSLFGGSGWEFLRSLLLTYPSQFPSGAANSVLNTPVLERTTAFQTMTDYIASDTRYSYNSATIDSRFSVCGPWYSNGTVGP